MKGADWLKAAGRGQVKELPDGRCFRELTALEVLEARREALALTSEQRERALCSNACLLARAVTRHGRAVYASGQEVLEKCTVSEIQDLARQWAEFDREEHPGLGASRERVDAIKKAWSTCRGSAFAGVCSAALERCRRNRGPKR